MLINTSRARWWTPSGRIGHLGPDVCEEEAELFCRLITGDALRDIAASTVAGLSAYENDVWIDPDALAC